MQAVRAHLVMERPCAIEGGWCVPCDERSELTIREAALRVRKSTRTIERWMGAGMDYRVENGRARIDHKALLEMWRNTLKAESERVSVLRDKVLPEQDSA